MTKQEHWFGVVEDWQRSGIGKHRYAMLKSIAYGTLQYWCKRYREALQPRQPASVEFLKLGEARTDRGTDSTSGMVIILPSGVRIEIR